MSVQGCDGTDNLLLTADGWFKINISDWRRALVYYSSVVSCQSSVVRNFFLLNIKSKNAMTKCMVASQFACGSSQLFTARRVNSASLIFSSSPLITVSVTQTFNPKLSISGFAASSCTSRMKTSAMSE